ncbi:adenylate/guanylate cyclase domain-containing protein [Shimia marina]|uniref:Adenylate cyclase 1 n=1 Tax=Shimia marina TaxID=321267 RepID=A0A0P1EK03_9RHOB|nr:adenylate/guanylate cyclase domain-containing protein [Shimia marina]CUH50824.1 Adenylate cyclase 1 [Shimia marina]SFE54007.1 adenylate/guanylate cyclase [Shimia marina]
MRGLWQGNWRVKTRIVSGLILFAYTLWHLISVGLGLFSAEWMEQSQRELSRLISNPVGGALLYGALLTHMGLALYRLAMRRTLRMPMHEVAQVILGVAIPFLVMIHVVHTRFATNWFGVDPDMGYITGLIWDSKSGWQQAALVLVVWIHGCIGLHMWLRVVPWWRRNLPVLMGVASLFPGFALAGFLTQGRLQKLRLFDPNTGAQLRADYGFPTAEGFARLAEIHRMGLGVFLAILGCVATIYLGRKLLGARRAVRIQYVDGPEIQGQPGMTLLEMSRTAGVPHMALCGGRGRCTTCRVIVEAGLEALPTAAASEAASLAAVNAPPNARLACQLRPKEPATVLRVYRSDGQQARAHQSLGQERQMAILFLDMRGFTARTTGQLPYDVVFLLNRFFDAIVPSITGAGGTVDKYLGDGLLAVFEQEDEAASARAAMEAAIGISSALATFNQALRSEKAQPVAIGMGVHSGTLVIGEIGAAQHAPRTIIGDTVNAASRLEGATKELGVELLVSESALRAVGQDVDVLDLEILELRGVAEPMLALPVQIGSDLREILMPAAVA